MHGWSESGKNSIFSEPTTIDDFKKAIELYTLLEQFSKDGETKSANLDFLNAPEPNNEDNILDGSEKVDTHIIAKDDTADTDDIYGSNKDEIQVKITGENAFD